MFRIVFLIAMSLLTALPAHGQSFDCAKATTPFEHAICDDPKLGAADERLAKTYATAIGGLSEKALAALRADQRSWLDFAQRACTADAKPMTQGRYDESGRRCLANIFGSRSGELESSRMIDGARFYPLSRFAAMPDPDSTPDSPWTVATHELSYVQLDSEAPYTAALNAFLAEEATKLSNVFGAQGGPEDIQEDPSSDSSNSITVKERVGDKRITFDVSAYWYGHGAAHGNWTGTYLHYLIDEKRPLAARDIFAAKGWQKALLDLTVAALKAEHGDALMLDDTKYIAQSITDPSRWDLSDPYGLVLQFQPYEVAAYAYGAPTATVSWEALEPYLADTAQSMRYGY